MQPVAQPKKLERDELLERLVASISHRPRDAMEATRVKREAEQLMVSDRQGALQVLGMVAAVKYEVEEIKMHYEQAMSLSPTTTTLRNYALSQNIAYNMQKAWELSLDLFKADPSNPKNLDRAISYSGTSGNLHEQLRLIDDEWSKRNPGKEHPSRKLVAAAVSILKKNSISDDQFAKYLDLAHGVIRRHKLDIEQSVLAVYEVPGTLEAVSINLEVQKNAVELSWELWEEKAGREDIIESDALIIAFTTSDADQAH